MRRRLGLVVAVALLAGACGGDGPDAGGGDPPGQGGSGVEVAEAAVRVLGEDVTAATAVVFALDRGYSLAQVVDAILGSQLEASGLIVVGGSAVTPDGLAFDVIIDKDSVGAWVMILALGPTAGGALTVAEFVGYMEGFQSWASTQIDEQRQRELEAAEEWARQEEAEAAAAAVRQAERLERLETIWATFTILNLSDRGYSAEQIITAIVLGLVQCSEIPMLLEEFRCDIPGESPAEATVPPTGPSVVADGYYRATFEPDYGDDATIEEARVSMIVSEGRYALNVNISYTNVWTSGDGSLSCTNWHEVNYTSDGEGSETSILFTGRMVNEYTSTCEDGGLFSSSDDWTVRVLVPDLIGRFQGGDFTLVRED